MLSGYELLLRFLGRCLFVLVAGVIVVFGQGVWAQALPEVSGRTVVLPTGANHKLFIPDDYEFETGDAGVDLLVHFHGDAGTVQNNAGYAGLNAVVLNVSYSGLSSAYSGPFRDVDLFGEILDGAVTALRAQPGLPNDVMIDQLSLSSFSAGYGAVREILKQPGYYNQIDGLLLADSLYASFTGGGDNTPRDSQMVDFRAFASDAANGDKTMIVTHSQVPTFTYSNTAETADDLIQHVGATVVPNNTNGLGTLQFYRTATQGNFKVWGARGADGDAHLAHLRYIGEFLDELPFDAGPAGQVEPVPDHVVLVDFELDEGTFNFSPLYSGSNVGIATATADRFVGEAYSGEASQRISVTHNEAEPKWLLRHTSGGAFPSRNVAIDSEGYIGFWLKTDTEGLSVQIGLDNPASADLSTELPIVADGEWHLYQWNLDDDDAWNPWVDGNGTIEDPTFTIDAIFFHGSNDAVIYLDDVGYNNQGVIASPIPAPTAGASFLVLALMMMTRRRAY